MELHTPILILISVLLTILSFYVLLRNPKNPICISFFVMTFGAIVWVLSNSTNTGLWGDIFMKLMYVGALILLTGFTYFSFYFPYKITNISFPKHLIVITPCLIMILILYTTNLFIIDYDENGKVLTGFVYNIFAVYFLTFWFWGSYNLVKKYKNAYGIHRWQLKNIFLALILPFIAGVTTNLLLPWLFNIWHLVWVGPMFSIIFFGFASYIIFKKKI